MRKLILVVLLGLSACASNGPKVVTVPVPVHCASVMPTEPVYQVVSSEDGLFVRVQKLLANDKLREGYISVLQAWGTGCNF